MLSSVLQKAWQAPQSEIVEQSEPELPTHETKLEARGETWGEWLFCN